MPEASPSTRARILAALYLFLVTSGIYAQVFIADALIISDDATTTAANIVANTTLYRLAFTIFMLEMVSQVAVARYSWLDRSSSPVLLRSG